MKLGVKGMLWTGIMLLIMASCSRFSDEITVSSRNFGDEVARQQNLVFTFSEELVPDDMVGVWTADEYITFNPPVAGRFRFTTTRELMFSPTSGFDPSKEYTATLNDRITSHVEGLKPLTSDRVIRFHTPYLRADHMDLFWTETAAGSGRPMLRASIVFNYEVDPAEVQRRLGVQIDGRPANISLLSTNVDKVVSVSIDGLNPQTVAGSAVAAHIEAGLPCAECDYVTPDAMQVGATVADPERLAVLAADPEFEGSTARIRVRTNQRVTGVDLRHLLKIEPQVTISTEATADGFVIRGPFRSGTTYELTVSEQLRGILGGRMSSPFQGFVPFGEMEPSIRFTSAKGLYLSNRGSQTVGVEIINVPKIHMMVYKIYENNVLNYINSYRYTNWYSGSSMSATRFGDFGYSYYSIGGFGDLILERTLETRDLASQDGTHLFTLDLKDDGRHKGVYLVNVASTENQWLGAWRMVSYSDIGLMVKSTGDEVVVFANSISTTEPLANVEVRLISSNNQEMKVGKTDGKGIARIGGLLKDAAGFRLGMVTARHGEDFNMIVMGDTRVENSRFDVGGVRSNPAGYQAFVYPERDIYRPGETIHLNTLLRDQQWNLPGKMPVVLLMRLPNGREMGTQQSLLTDQGAAEFSVPLDAAAVTGTYVAELYTSNKILLASMPISVEEFLPDRIKVALDAGAGRIRIGEQIAATITATNLFGPPAAFRNYETTLNLSRMAFTSQSFGDYRFDIQGKDRVVLQSDLRQGKTDASGQATERFTVAPEYRDMGLLHAQFFSTVFDESGRPVNQVANVVVETQPVFFGIRQLDGYADLARPVTLSFVAFRPDESPAGGTQARIQIVRYEWQNVIQRNYDDRYRYVSQKKEIVVTDRQVTLEDGTHTMSFLPQTSGEYEVRIMRPGAEGYVAQNFYAYGFGFTQGSSFEVDTDGQIAIEADKESYRPGDTAKLLFKTPFAGRLIVTVERSNVLETYELMTDKRAAILDLKLKDAHVPNIYVTATLLKPLADNSVPLTTAHGFQSIRVERADARIPITISAPETSRSRSKQTVRVKAENQGAVEMTIAVVDEGILQLKNFRTPDPYGAFYAKRALEVDAFDVYPYLFPDILRRSSPGGDGYDLAMRVNPMGARRANLVSFWSGVVKTNSRGEAEYTIDIPPYSGTLRVMAVAWNGRSFGSADRQIRVADPVVISSALPRFLSPGDSLDLGVTLSNTTAGAASGSAKVSTQGPVRVVGADTKPVSVAANAESRTEFGLVADRNIGAARVDISVSALGETFLDTVSIPVRAAAGLVKRSGSGQLAGQSATLNLAEGLQPGTVSGRLLVSRSPLVSFADALSTLLAYPYGCAEQTVSTAFPQLYYEDLSALLEQPGSRRPSDPSYNVQQAISKLETMQLYNGSLAYWPGGNYESWWATTYAAHFMREAQKAGFEVNGDILQRMYWYLEQRLRERTTTRYYYNDENGVLVEKTIAPKEVAYSLYVLALAGQPDLPGMNYYRDNLQMLALDSRYLLAAAYLQTGDRAAYEAILPERFAGERSLPATGGSFHSFIRDQGITLNTLLESDPSNPQIAPLARQLSEQLARARYLSTQESAFALLALGKFLRAEAGNTATAQVQAGGRTLGTFSGKDLVITDGIAGGPVTIQASGSGNVYYFWESQGLGLDGAVEETDQVLSVRRTLLNRAGGAITGRQFRQNDLVVVKISLRTLDGSSVDNVAVTDLLPAGFEIENPRIGDVPELQWIADASVPDHMDIRDDRINLFTSATGEVRHFYYVVRAVSKGRFRQGPVSADAMYNGAYHSYHGAGTVVIGDR